MRVLFFGIANYGRVIIFFLHVIVLKPAYSFTCTLIIFRRGLSEEEA